MVQFPHGNSLIPNSLGSAYMMYSNTMKPADSIVAHPILPSMFHRDSIDVLPCGYQSSTHCAVVTCNRKVISKCTIAAQQPWLTYKREIRPDAAYQFPILARGRQPVLQNRHCEEDKYVSLDASHEGMTGWMYGGGLNARDHEVIASQRDAHARQA
jgi:hypothetical protein